MPNKYGKCTRDFGAFCFYWCLLFYILEAFLIKQLFYSRLLDIGGDDYSQLGATRLVGQPSSHIQRALVE